jgi:hypothetical protein
MEPGYTPPPLAPIVREPEESIPHKLLVPILIGAVIVLFITTGVFAYQNERLRHDLAVYQMEHPPVQTPTLVSPNPTDETSGWLDTQSNEDVVKGIPYTFKYPPNAVIGGANDFTTITVNNSEIRFTYYGKSGDVNAIMGSYKPFGVEKQLQFTNKEAVTLNRLSGYKATATNSTATYYFLANTSMPTKVILFTFSTDDKAAENLLLKIIGTIKAI